MYLLDNPVTNKTAVSEITALSGSSFLVDERDGNVPPNSYKKLWKIELNGATDIWPAGDHRCPADAEGGGHSGGDEDAVPGRRRCCWRR